MPAMMLGNGLGSSMWAPGNAQRSTSASSYVPRSGDWDCRFCFYPNFASRQSCHRCLQPQFPTGPRSTGGYAIPKSRENVTVFEHAETLSPPPPYTVLANNTNVPTAESRMRSRRYGLATSRWAPRGSYSDEAVNEGGGPQIWTRTVSISRAAPENTAITHAHPAPEPQDLGLPYEVQHYILTMMERILEEACFEFAKRWIPKILYEQNYTCYEAVELAQWRRLLPTHIPRHALQHVPDYNLQKALADAVRIRNSAQHRHLCNNVELRRMAEQSEKLMVMFSEPIRQSKFIYLRLELEEWDKLSTEDQQTAKSRLRSVLQEISERPVSEMDWTPNSESLEEIGMQTTVSVPTQELEEQYHDEMDLD
ncbi:Ran BP2/NZF zinc finger-like protein [Glarea lozoyensis ATCC 20868]|uniref:Ran BP2/NZF zinc finger-like protein n=1 Tax=Glarea lozoyensis (strain ATCC 20868 / MF5171) TaxID=1116229 RepID=S3D4F4_GLAL2|nr:Ran BP2/NZF zinc finger-like protein [Glarea lozoyensis ATCC 20868]EPE31999.1 Ran BP2/NZF zinc finger-like protein [Glarea lozoyensis ATCC 20868]